ncbi:glycosyltransferase [Glaciecola petra]|uniref:Glycosyltransferase family 2 protein n=1 Tax=Glaciecola petra TaxID=3075602 RepID=A0ABU2ZLW4_9ALTE|nr:glycosyltransferase family 2 protein [Aestuariibacter sp. P117]MDT0593612.1 glycosyltransferase family 2 protein [Aestuariibacter sp. P117]
MSSKLDQANTQHKPDLKVSFVIPHKGRTELLEETICSIDQLNYQGAYEIIVVSKNQGLVLATATTCKLTVIEAPEEWSISKQRNEGAAKAKGEFIAFIDADVELKPDWIQVMLDNYNQNVSILTSPQIPCINAPATEVVRSALQNLSIQGNPDSLAGSNLFLSKSIFLQTPGFPEHLSTCEDVFFTASAASIKPLMATFKTSHIHLGEDKSLIKLLKKEIWRGQANIASLSGRKIPLSEYPSIIAPLMVVFGTLASLVLIIFGFGSLSLIAILLGISPIVAYSLRLFIKARTKLNFVHTFSFYVFYFFGRALGTIKGAINAIF